MADQAQASRADLEQAISLIMKSQENILGIQRKLDTANADLAAHWVGTSRAAFVKVTIAWHERMDVILQSLTKLAESVQSNNKNYDLFNQQEEERFNKIAAMIDADLDANLKSTGK
ncbi:WXG100 family type VII secretion target [Nonomuraea sp. NPDC049152]|uniref:WXG100 family type VII secretion target n=1 Tax=Nonomuraea sp. NPDC049152 TaxID=3154350 RepID=UPI0033DCDD57